MNKTIWCIFIYFIANSQLAIADNELSGFSIDSTRMVYLAQNKSANITVSNSASNIPVLIQSWVTDASPNDKKISFIVTPPLYRQDRGSNTLRISFVGSALPTKMESLFYLNVKAIPAAPKNVTKNSATLNSSFTQRIKIFYRPKDLAGDVSDAYKKLTFIRAPVGVTVNNPTPYYVSLYNMSVNGKDISDQARMIAPFAKQYYRAENVSEIKYSAINDYGGITDEINTSVR